MLSTCLSARPPRPPRPPEVSLESLVLSLQKTVEKAPERELNRTKINIPTHRFPPPPRTCTIGGPSFFLSFFIFFFLGHPPSSKVHQSYYWSGKLCRSSEIAVTRVRARSSAPTLTVPQVIGTKIALPNSLHTCVILFVSHCAFPLDPQTRRSSQAGTDPQRALEAAFKTVSGISDSRGMFRKRNFMSEFHLRCLSGASTS